MEVINNLSKLNVLDDKIAITIGNFDGVHRGHQSLIHNILKDCKRKGEALVVCTFVPHPKVILSNSKNFLINSYEERRELLTASGVDYIVEFDFNRDFSTLNPGKFLDQHIFVNTNIKSLYLGHDFAFGANKAGDHDFVLKYCKEKGVDCVLEKQFVGDLETKPSSTNVRKFLESGAMKEANDLLGRNFFVSGRIIKGQGRGKQIGFPTANIHFETERICPRIGVYKSQVTYKGMIYESITNVGVNPTFNDESPINFETHIFDFDNDIYGEEIKVEIISFIRDEKKFKSVNDLIKQIKVDISKVKGSI